MAFSLEELQRIRKQYDEGRQKKQEEIAKKTNAAPEYRELPSLSRDTRRSRETEEQRSALQVQAENKANPNYDRIEEDRMRREVAQKRIENEMKQIEAMGMDASQTDLNRYNQLYNTAEGRGFIGNDISVNDFEVDKYLDPNYRMSKSEEQTAKTVVNNYFKRNPDAKKLLQMSTSNPYRASQLRSQMSDKQRNEYDRITSLMNKTSNLSAYTYGLMNIMPFGNTAMDKLGEMAGGDSDYNYSMQKQNVRTQSPLAFTGGDMTSKLAAYSVLGKALEGIPALGQATNELGQTMAFGNKAIGNSIGNILRGNIADIVLDTIPSEIENYKNGMSAKDIAIDALKNEAANTAFNAVGEIPSLIKAFRGLGKADNAVDAIKQTGNVEPIEQAMAEQEAEVAEQIAKEQAQQVVKEAPTVPTVAEPQSLIKEEPVEQIAKETPVKSDKIAEPQSAINPDDYVVTTIHNKKGEERYIIKRGTEDKNSYAKEFGRKQYKTKEDAINAIQEKAQISQVGETQSLLKGYEENTIGDLLNNPQSYTIEDTQKALRIMDRNAGIEYYNTKDEMLDALRKMVGDDEGFANIDLDTDITKGVVTASTTPDVPKETPTSDYFDKTPNPGDIPQNNGVTIQEMLDDPEKYSKDDFAEALRLIDRNAGIEYDTEKEEIIAALLDELDNEPGLADIKTTIGEVPPAKAKKGKGSKKNNKANKVMAEDIGINPNTELDEIDDVAREADEIIDGNNALKPQEEYNIIESEEPDPGIARGSITETNGVKERGQSIHIRGEGKMKMDVPEPVRADFKDNPDMYIQLKNADTAAKAERIYNDSNIDTETEFRKMLEAHDPAALPLGRQIANDYSAQGNYEMASQIYRDMGEQLTKSGQFSQAAIINMMKDDPFTAYEYARKEIDKINRNGKQLFGDQWNNFKMTDEEIDAFKNIKPGDEKAIKKLYNKIGNRLAKDYPVKMIDKLLEARRVGMLFNPRTHIRNIVANVPTLGMRWTADRVEAVGQNIAHLINPEIKVTQSITGSGREGRKLAKEIFEGDAVQALVKGTDGKYTEGVESALMENKQIFKGTGLEKWIDRVSGDIYNKAAEAIANSKGIDAKHIDGGLQALNKKFFDKEGVESVAETLRNTTYKLLDLGDSPFVKENFIERLGSYINAQGIKSIDEVPEEAIQTAWEEAMKATYKDNSWAVEMLKGFRGGFNQIPGVGKPMGQAVIPFLQAPGNIAARMVDYSPIRGTKGIADIISGARANDVKKVTQGIEEFSKGATGTGMVILGMRLKKSGLITGDYSSDKDQKEQQKREGFRPFALHIGDKYFTYDWAQPFAESLIIGTLLQETIDNSDEYDSEILKSLGYEGTKAGKAIGAIGTGAKASFNSWFNASPLQGLSSLLSGGDSNDSGDIAQGVIDTTVGDFASSFIPAPVNAYTKTKDTTQRNTYDATNKFTTFINQQKAKLPGLSDDLPARYDTWGKEMKYADSTGNAAIQRFVSPGEFTTEKHDPIDKEIDALFESTGDNGVFAPKAPYKIDDRKLTNVENSKYQKDMGQRNRELVEAFMDSDMYEDMDDEEKADVLKNLYGVSKVITERDVFDKDVSGSNNYKKALAAYDDGDIEGLVDFYTVRQQAESIFGSTEDWARDAYKNGTIDDINKAKKAKEIAEDYGFDSISKKEWETFRDGTEKDLKDMLELKQKAAEAGVTDSKAFQQALEDGATVESIKTVGEQLASLGLDKPAPNYTYQKAVKEIPGLTMDSFVNQYKDIDFNSNQAITQDEVIDYLNRGKYTQSYADQLWAAYGASTWKKKPKQVDGKWVKK